MIYAGGAREISSDGTIRISGRPRPSGTLAVALFLGLSLILPALRPALSVLGDAVIPLSLLLVCMLFALPLLPMFLARRSVVFDAGRRELRVRDQGALRQADVILPFSEIKELSFVQREPRPVANAPPTLVVNEYDLLTVEQTYANRDLELELKALVGLPLVESLRDRRGLSGA